MSHYIPYLIRAVLMIAAGVANHFGQTEVGTGLMAMSVAIPSQRP